MISRSEGGVVDSSLRVYGTLNVRVADMSVVPLLPGTHVSLRASVQLLDARPRVDARQMRCVADFAGRSSPLAFPPSSRTLVQTQSIACTFSPALLAPLVEHRSDRSDRSPFLASRLTPLLPRSCAQT